jgi:hypothetical protein
MFPQRAELLFDDADVDDDRHPGPSSSLTPVIVMDVRFPFATRTRTSIHIVNFFIT